MSEIWLPRSGWLIWPETQKLAEAFRAEDQQLRFVGGAVRDALLKREVKDVDAATPTPPQKVMSLLERQGIKVVPTGLSHGTVTAVVDGTPFEITTLRRDVQTNGRHAEVVFTHHWQEDAARRDFTFNALYCDAGGKIYDYFHGVEDARSGVVRFIGDPLRRIDEDGLRILRFFRFNALYGEGSVDTAGLQACAARASMLDKLSGERIQQEMLKLLSADEAAELIEMMERAGLLGALCLGGVEAHSLAAWPRVRLMADCEADSIISLALLLRSLRNAGPQREALAKRWRLSTRAAARLEHAVHSPSLHKDTPEKEQKILIRRNGVGRFVDQVLISWAEQLNEAPVNAPLLAVAFRSMLALALRWEPPAFPLTGADLQFHGVRPGPEMGHWLKKLEGWWEREGFEPGKEELLEHFTRQGGA